MMLSLLRLLLLLLFPTASGKSQPPPSSTTTTTCPSSTTMSPSLETETPGTPGTPAVDVEQLREEISTAIKAEHFWESDAIDTGLIDPEYKDLAKEFCDDILIDDSHLRRLLVARNYDKTETISLFWEQVRFRSRMQPKNISPEDLPNALPSGAWRLCGTTKDGRVLSVYKASLWNPDAYGDDVELAVAEYTKYVCYMCELMVASNKHERGSVIFDLDCSVLGLAASSNIRGMIRRLIYIAQAQYPEEVEKIYLLNAPWAFYPAWKLISVFLEPKTAEKVQFCTSQELLEDIDAEVLSKEYGGLHDEYPIPTKTIQEEAYKH